MSDNSTSISAASDPQDQIRALEAEVAALRKQLASAPSGKSASRKGGHSRARSFWSALLIIVACLLAPLSVVSVWARGEITDTDRYVATVAPLASEPAIQEAVSARVTDHILAAIDVEQYTQQAVDTISANRSLTPQQTAVLQSLVAPIDNGISGFVSNKVNQVVASDQFAALWAQANTRLHQQLNSVLSGENTGSVSIEGDKLVLDVGDVVAEVKTQLVAEGFTVAEKIPTVDTTIVLFESNSLSRAQTAYAALNALGYWLPLIAITIGLIGVFLANSSRKGLLGLGIGLLIVMLLGGVSYAIGRAILLNELPANGSAAAATALIDQVSYFLRQALWAGAAAGVVLILGAVFTGPSRFAVGVRGLAIRAAAVCQRQLASWGATMTNARRWVAQTAAGLRVAAGIIAIAVVMFQRYKTVELVLWTTVGLLVVLFIIQIFASDAASDPSASKEPAIDG